MKAIKLTILAATLLTAGITTARAQSAEEIITKHNEAIGGAKNWDKIKSLKMTGSMNVQGMDLSFTQTTVDDKGMRMDISVMGMANFIIVTPKGAWMYMPVQGQTKIDTLPAAQLKQYASKMNIKSGQIIEASSLKKSEYLGKDTINNVPCYKLHLVDNDGTEKTDYFEVSTYYLIRQELSMKGDDDAVQEIATSYSNFQKQEGVVIPMNVNAASQDVTFKSAEINKPVDDKIFLPVMPPTAK